MFLLDTNVVSELRKVRANKADEHVTAWARSAPHGSLFISVIVVLELELGTLLAERKDPAKGAILRTWLDEHVQPGFDDRILPIDLVVARRSAALHVPADQPPENWNADEDYQLKRAEDFLRQGLVAQRLQARAG